MPPVPTPIQITKFILGFLRTNVFIIHEGNEAILIDPAQDPENKILKYLKQNNLKLKYILLTHGHFDHTGSLKKIKQETKAPVAYHPSDKKLLSSLHSTILTLGRSRLKPDISLRDGNKLRLSNSIIQVIHTPGHTKGSLCFYLKDKKILFSGDTLFANGFGRTDLPGGSLEEMRNSLRKLSRLPPGTRVMPGHGPEFILGKTAKNMLKNLYAELF